MEELAKYVELRELLKEPTLPGKRANRAVELIGELDGHFLKRALHDVVEAKEPPSDMFFVRLYNWMPRRELTAKLNTIIGGRWMYSHYALTEARPDLFGKGAKPLMIVVKDAEAMTLLKLFLEEGYSDKELVSIKQVDPLPDSHRLFSMAMYRGQHPDREDYPWNLSNEAN